MPLFSPKTPTFASAKQKVGLSSETIKSPSLFECSASCILQKVKKIVLQKGSTL